MSNAAKHRKKAAEFEQLKQIDRAIASYVRAIEESEQAGEDVDVALLNKVGDLALRQGRVPDAITYYERAVEHYTNAGLFNNAIALCNKILRNAPGRANVYFTLGRICARKGLRGDATRNFLEYATRMQQEERVDEGMRALAEVADLMPELTEVRRLVDEHADRAGIVLRRRMTPSAPVVALEEPPKLPGREKSQDLIFLEVDYGAPASRRTPLRTPRVPTPMAVAALPAVAVAVVSPVDDVASERDTEPAPTRRPEPLIERLEGLEASGDYTDLGEPPLAGLTVEDPESPDLVVDPAVHPSDVTWLPDAGGLAGVRQEAGFEPNATGDQSAVSGGPVWLEEFEPEEFGQATDDAGIAQIIRSETSAPEVPVEWIEHDVTASAIGSEPLDVTDVPELDAAIAAGAQSVLAAETVVAGPKSLFRIDPHDFILPGELPPLVLDDALVTAGLAALTASAVADAGRGVPTLGALSGETGPEQVGAGQLPAGATRVVPQGRAPGDASVGAVRERPVMVTPALPMAAVATEATMVATSRRDALRGAVARHPQDWLLRRRLAEALFEAGERDAALAELETAQQGLAAQGELSASADIADTLVQVSPERIAFHQKRVELSVRLKDQQRLRVAYLDLADALVRIGEEGRARAVYARVLEIDPYDDRARAALGSAAPPAPPKPDADGPFVNLAEWLRDENEPTSTRMRMREPAISGDEQADFHALLRHFKEGVARSLGEDDYDSHYDLGVAYKEMGLLDDAIEEFQKALRSRSHRLPAYEALGQCFVEQGRHQVAATVLSRALHEPGLDDEQRVGVLYLLAYSCEALKRWDEARSYYQRVYATDIHFRDTAARLAALDQVAR
jgi:tetratricopeptide (TPR) repeat protein